MCGYRQQVVKHLPTCFSHSFFTLGIILPLSKIMNVSECLHSFPPLKPSAGFAISWSNADFSLSLAAKLLRIFNRRLFFLATLGKRLSQTKTCNHLCPEGMVLFALAALTQFLLSHDYPPAEQCVPGEMKTGLSGVSPSSLHHYTST